MIHSLEKFVSFLHKKYGITPEILTYIKIFGAPWLALLISKVLSSKSLLLAIIVLIFYIALVATSFLEKPLSEIASKKEKKDYSSDNMLSHLSNKILIIFALIPFGLNLFTFLLISAESIFVFQAIFLPESKKPSDKNEVTKIILQILLIPILILQAATSFVPELVIYIYILIVIISTYFSIYSHFFYFKE